MEVLLFFHVLVVVDVSAEVFQKRAVVVYGDKKCIQQCSSSIELLSKCFDLFFHLFQGFNRLSSRYRRFRTIGIVKNTQNKTRNDTQDTIITKRSKGRARDRSAAVLF